MVITPLHDRVLVKPIVRSLSDVLIVKNTEKFNEGTIVAIGPDVHDVKVGEQIKYGNGTYLDWPLHKINGEDHQLIQEGDVACVVDPD
jgi:co-chaperonin GroES (HSP10)